MTGRNNTTGWGSYVSSYVGAPYAAAPTITQTGNTFTSVSGVVLPMGAVTYVYGTFVATSTVSNIITITLPAGIVSRGATGTPDIAVGWLQIRTAPTNTPLVLVSNAAASTTVFSKVAYGLTATAVYDFVLSLPQI